MRFAVFSHVQHYIEKQNIFAYSPYVKEMNLWGSLVDELIIIAPEKKNKTETDIAFYHSKIQFKTIKSICFNSFINCIVSIQKLPEIIFKIFSEMQQADHIHIRCPGNIGLLACIVQIIFPRKRKTIKYAGNWDPNSKQPVSYKFQRWLLKNKFLTRNAHVLVYGEWNSSNQQVRSFFTASYSEIEIKNYRKELEVPYKFVYVGSLSEGKRPLMALGIIEQLLMRGYKVKLDIYGAGPMFSLIESTIEKRNLNKHIFLHGGKNQSTIKAAYKASNFSILPSKSEGWPKALAEAMFYGCVPIGAKISCIPWMLGYGERGILIDPDLYQARSEIEKVLLDQEKYKSMSLGAQKWAQIYTLEKFEREIRNLL